MLSTLRTNISFRVIWTVKAEGKLSPASSSCFNDVGFESATEKPNTLSSLVLTVSRGSTISGTGRTCGNQQRLLCRLLCPTSADSRFCTESSSNHGGLDSMNPLLVRHWHGSFRDSLGSHVCRRHRHRAGPTLSWGTPSQRGGSAQRVGSA